MSAIFSTTTYKAVHGEAPHGVREWVFQFCIAYQRPVEESTSAVMSFATAKRWALKRAEELRSHMVCVQK